MVFSLGKSCSAGDASFEGEKLPKFALRLSTAPARLSKRSDSEGMQMQPPSEKWTKDLEY